MEEKELPQQPKQELETSDFLAMDEADEQQFIDMMKGGIIKEWVYDVRGNYQLSATGTREAALAYAEKKGKGFDVEAPQVEFSPDSQEIRVWIKATDLNTGSSTIGAKAGPTSKEFYYETTVSKAERNAKQHLLPGAFVASFIDFAIKNGLVKRLGGERPKPTHQAQRPAPSPIITEPTTEPDPFADFVSPGYEWEKLPKQDPLLKEEAQGEGFDPLKRLRALIKFTADHVPQFQGATGAKGQLLSASTSLQYWFNKQTKLQGSSGRVPFWRDMVLAEAIAAWHELKKAFPEQAQEAEENVA